MNILHQITIADYRRALRGRKPDNWAEISRALQEALGGDKLGSAIFKAHKELLILQHQFMIKLVETGNRTRISYAC
ncbi:MAG: hypothetical protein LBH06_07020 [Rikenellaceae bacterium]|jgi:hypothetical protein|nr:hypothetical protein [Rikenellaceae bacterium]